MAVASSARARKVKKKIKPNKDAEAPDILSGEGIAMMAAAAAFDLIPPVFVLTLNIFFGLGELLSWSLDILATMILGTWMFMRGGEKTFGKKFGRFLKRRAPFIVAEYVPLLGAGPWWMVNVFLFLKK